MQQCEPVEKREFCTGMHEHKINSYRKKWLLHPNNVRGEMSQEQRWAYPRGLQNIESSRIGCFRDGGGEIRTQGGGSDRTEKSQREWLYMLCCLLSIILMIMCDY
jgi:hypothetical protein